MKMELTVNQSATLATNAFEIKRLGKQTADNVIQIGKLLTECKGICGHKNWFDWLDKEFKWTDQTARNFMNVYEMGN
jgi:hypothetical protein